MSGDVPSLEAYLAIEENRLKDAIRYCHGFGMDAATLMKSVMVLLKGRANPAEVLQLAKEYLENGHRFLK